MNKKLWIIISTIILFTLIIAVFFVNNYKLFRVYEKTDGGGCMEYYKSCTCIGWVIMMKSYPPQYDCKGLELCKNIIETTCTT